MVMRVVVGVPHVILPVGVNKAELLSICIIPIAATPTTTATITTELRILLMFFMYVVIVIQPDDHHQVCAKYNTAQKL